MKKIFAPIEAEPAHVPLDGIDIFLLLFGRIGIVKAQMAAPAKLFRRAEIQADRFGMANMQIAVRLRRESGNNTRDAARFEIGRDDIADEIATDLADRRLHRHEPLRSIGKSAATGFCKSGASRQERAKNQRILPV